jgi:photosystem II stability/assembly factor-like uncharacterized protein
MNSSSNRTRARRITRSHTLSLLVFIIGTSVVLLAANLNRAGAQKTDSDKSNANSTADAARVRVNEDYGKLPLAFEINQGQAARDAQFVSRGNGYRLLLKPTEAELTLRRSTAERRDQEGRSVKRSRGAERRQTESKTVKLSLIGATETAVATPQGELPTKSNYLVGNVPEKWRSGIANYAQVKYGGVYPGVDVVYYGNQNQLEYDFLVAPGSDPNVIRLGFTGAQQLEIDETGDLVLHVGDSTIRQSKPIVYQETENGRREVKGQYVLKGKDEIGFEIGEYDKSKALVIDPILAYSTYLNFFVSSVNNGMAIDALGNVYVTGTDEESVYVAKLNPQGTAFVFTTTVGGDNGDEGANIAVDALGNVFVSGNAYSNEFPVVNAFQPTRGNEEINVADTFVFKLDPTGSNLLFSTFLGGDDDDINFGMALDLTGNVYLTGYTASPSSSSPGGLPFPTHNAYQSTLSGGVDGYLTKFTGAGAIVYSTYIGGDNYDFGLDVAVDAEGSAYLTGQTFSGDYPTVNPLQPARSGSGADAFVTKFTPSGASLSYSTYLGGTLEDMAWGIALDTTRNIYVTGFTRSMDFPTMNPIQPANGGTGRDAFVSKINAAGSSLAYSTYLGGAFAEEAADIAVNATGEAYVTGFTASANFPLVNPLQPSNGNSTDAFITKVNASGSAWVYSTYLGGTSGFGGGPGAGSPDYGTAIVLGPSGDAYVFGETYATDFPLVNPLQPTLIDYRGGFLSRLNESGNQTFYTISGFIESNVGNRMAGVTVTLSGTQTATTQTDAIGVYSFNGLAAGGSYTVTPSLAGSTFDPASTSFQNLAANQTANFMKAPRTYHIGGRVTDAGGDPIANVKLDIAGYIYPIERYTDSDGKYLLTYVEANRQYTVTPVHNSYSFTPRSRSFNLTSNQLSTDFTAVNNSGLSVNLTGPAAGSTYQAPANITVSANASSSNSTISKVEFFAGGNLIGTDNTAPYSIDWTNVAGGVYSLTALATDAAGATKASSAISIIVNSASGPTVAITNPANNSTMFSGRYILLSANASSSAGTITKVDFYEGTQRIGSDTTGPPYLLDYYLYEGTYVLTAVAHDSSGAVTQSSPVNLTVVDNQSPTVTLTSPANNSTYPANANIDMTANASDPEGTVVSVKFFAGSTLVGEDTTAPYAATWNNAQPGLHTLIARAVDSQGGISYSNPVDVQVGNRAPFAVITSPSSNTQFTAPASITINAIAGDPDGSVAQVQFFAGGTLIGTDTTAPYSATWENVPAGNYDLVVRVTDNEGATASSSYVFVRVFANVPSVTITEPATGATFVSPATITVTANATVPAEGGNSIQYVAFYVGTQNLGFSSTPPYSITWSNVPAGTYSVTAVASDRNSATTTSAPVEITVSGNIGNWRLQVPQVTSGVSGLTDVDMISASEGWAVNGGGSIFHTTDGGLTWAAQNSGTTEPLNAVSFFDSMRGLAIGNVALYTTNGGQTWLPSSGALGTYYDLDFVTPNTGYACGGGGVVLKTNDGGASWGIIATPILQPHNLVSLDFIDLNTGWVVGQGGTVIATTNGGASWTIQNPGTSAFMAGVSFVNANEGWAVAGNYFIHTTNGGQTWTQQSVPANTWAYAVFFLDSQNGWAVGSQENIVHTSNGGQTWTTQRGGSGSEFIQPLWSVSFGDAVHGLTAGNSVVLTTGDGGTTWGEPLNNYRTISNRVFATDSTHAWSANSKSEVLYTVDGGIHWSKTTLFTPTDTSNVTDITFADNQNGWATVNEGLPGFIYKSTDGGQTWQNAGAPASAPLRGIAKPDSQTIVAIGDSNTILRSTNGGTNWSPVTAPGTGNLKDVHFVNASVGWIVGDSRILKTTNGGQTWTAQSAGPEPPSHLLSVSFADVDNGWVAGRSDLLRTTDGGQTWVAQDVEPGVELGAVQAITSSIGWIAGTRNFINSYVAQTTDGGAAWSRDNLNQDASLSSCFFLDENNGWVGGSSFTGGTEGRIYHRTGNQPTPVPLRVTLTSPPDGSVYDGRPITVSADALNITGVISQVDFYDGAILIATDTTAPYNFVWANAQTGSHTVTARVTGDMDGRTAASFAVPATINVTSAPNTAPTISVTSPTAGATYRTGVGVPLAANANDTDGSVARVEFYSGTTLLATDTAAPFQSTWLGAPEGTHQLTALAFDNLGASTASTAITITIERRSAATAIADFDGDGRTDVSVFRASSGYWYLSQSSAGFRAVNFGMAGDRLAPGDYDGDGRTDVAVFRPSNGYWYLLDSSTGAFRYIQFGQSGDMTAPGEFDGDGKTDIGVFRPSTGYFYYLRSSDGIYQFIKWGQDGDQPVLGDYDGDGTSDFAIFRPSTSGFYVLRSSDGLVQGQQWGTAGDKPIAGDFDGDGKTDFAVFRPSAGAWYYLRSSDNSFGGIAWGSPGDIPAAGDYDGDGVSDVAVFRPSSGVFYIWQSATSALRAEQWGIDGDEPIPSAFVP